MAKMGFGYERAIRVVMSVCFAYCSSVLTMNLLPCMVVLGQLRLILNQILTMLVNSVSARLIDEPASTRWASILVWMNKTCITPIRGRGSTRGKHLAFLALSGAARAEIGVRIPSPISAVDCATVHAELDRP